MVQQTEIDVFVDHPEVIHALYGKLPGSGHVSIGRKFGAEPAQLGSNLGDVIAYLGIPYQIHRDAKEAIFSTNGSANDMLVEDLQAFVLNPEKCREAYLTPQGPVDRRRLEIGYGIIKHGPAYKKN